MIREYLGGSADLFAIIGAVATSVVGYKVATAVLRFLTSFFFAGPLGLSANLKKAGSWAVVTGCTDGIGKAYAEQLAAKGINIVLISRTISKLQDMAKEVEEKYKVETRVIAADFSQDGIYDEIQVKVQGLDIGVLVNNVGCSYDYPEYYAQLDIPDLVSKMIHMNCTSVAKMTAIVLPDMLKKKAGYIINIGSSAGSNPTPFLSLYSGTKAFVDLFTRSLEQEYAGKGVTFQVVIPYFVVSKLSKFRRATLTVPSPTTFVKSALNTVGVNSRTTGYWAHELQDFFVPIIPSSVKKGLMLQARSKALKKKAAAKTE